MDKAWWKEGIIYQIYPRSFNDSNGDGIGDLPGIIEKLDYLKSLNVDIIWISPIFQSPNDDNGYDVSDFRKIMEEFGTMEDFDRLLEGIHERGMRLILDMVPNHTSDEHAWFEASRKSKDNPYRDYYYWKLPVNSGPPNNWLSFFGGSVWEFDEKTGEYYLHYFSKKQPDLNWENEKVRQEVYDNMKFWLDKGVDGFRLDVITMISKNMDFPMAEEGNLRQMINDYYTNGPRLHEFLREMNKEVFAHYDVMALGEGPGISSSSAPLYTAEDRRELNVIYHFDHLDLGYGNGSRFDRKPFSLVELKNIFNKWDRVFEENGWVAVCLDNHDFPRMLSRFGNDGEFHDPSAKLLVLMLATMRGTIIIYQGSEIGMTNVTFDSIEDYDDIWSLNFYKEATVSMTEEEKQKIFGRIVENGRDNARTPMQWDDSPNGGFTTGEPWLKVNPNYPSINVAGQEKDTDSVWHFYRQTLGFRKRYPTFVYGKYESVKNDDPDIFAYRRWDDSEEFLILLNFSNSDQTFEIPEYLAGDWDVIGDNYGIDKSKYKGKKMELNPWQGLILKN